MNRKLFTLFIILLFAYVASPLFLPLAMGAVFAVLFAPLHEELEHYRVSPRLASAFLTFSITVLIVLPGALFIFLTAKAGLEQVRAFREMPAAQSGNVIENFLRVPLIANILSTLRQWYPFETTDLVSAIQDLVASSGIKLANALGTFLTQLPGLVMGMVVMVLSIYFFLLDRKRVAHFIRENSFYSPQLTGKLMRSFVNMCRSVILATVISGFVQSAIYASGCLILGVPRTLLIGFLVFLGSFVPLIGSAPITFGVALYQFFAVSHPKGIVLLVLAALVAVVDNFIRPFVLKGGANLHPLLAFIAAFGGLQVFGFLGIFLGPILAGLFMVTIQGLVSGAGQRPSGGV